MAAPSDRRYSEEEFRRILEAATEPREGEESGAEPHAEPARGPADGLTLAEIRGIAREVGIDPGAIDRAARNLDREGTIRVASSAHGRFTRLLTAETRVDRVLSEVEMRMLALESERVLERRGKVRASPGGVEWRDREERFSVQVTRAGDGTHLRVTLVRSAELLKDSVLLGGLGLAGVGAILSQGIGPGGPLAFAVLVATAAVLWLNSIGRAGADRERLEGVIQELRDAARIG